MTDDRSVDREKEMVAWLEKRRRRRVHLSALFPFHTHLGKNMTNNFHTHIALAGRAQSGSSKKSRDDHQKQTETK